MIFCMDFCVGCYGTARAGSSAELLLVLHPLLPRHSVTGQLASVHYRSLLVYISLGFYCSMSDPNLKLVTFFSN